MIIARPIQVAWETLSLNTKQPNNRGSGRRFRPLVDVKMTDVLYAKGLLSEDGHEIILRDALLAVGQRLEEWDDPVKFLSGRRITQYLQPFFDRVTAGVFPESKVGRRDTD